MVLLLLADSAQPDQSDAALAEIALASGQLSSLQIQSLDVAEKWRHIASAHPSMAQDEIQHMNFLLAKPMESAYLSLQLNHTPMKTSRQLLFKLVGALGVMSLICTTSFGATIISNNFSLGYGFTEPNPGSWNTTETASVNTPTTQGDFTFSPVVTGGFFGSVGVQFTNRVLSGSGGNWNGTAATFSVTINASYTGTPPDAMPDPNYKLTITITEIRIWGVALDTYASDDMWFNETTTGNTQSSPSITVLKLTGPQMNTVANWQQLTWDPGSYQVDGTTNSRTFTVGYSTDTRGLDGFEVFGNVTLTYDAIPEPSVAGLVLLGGLALYFGRHNRRQA